jgi:glycine/D-amino acid oxidase-like deaminating enzyme
MTQAEANTVGQTVSPDQIPTLTQDLALPQVPQAVHLALDARVAEKQALMALSEDLLQNLRPEIERLTADLVERTLQSIWDKRARSYQDV